MPTEIIAPCTCCCCCKACLFCLPEHLNIKLLSLTFPDCSGSTAGADYCSCKDDAWWVNQVFRMKSFDGCNNWAGVCTHTAPAPVDCVPGGTSHFNTCLSYFLHGITSTVAAHSCHGDIVRDQLTLSTCECIPDPDTLTGPDSHMLGGMTLLCFGPDEADPNGRLGLTIKFNSIDIGGTFSFCCWMDLECRGGVGECSGACIGSETICINHPPGSSSCADDTEWSTTGIVCDAQGFVSQTFTFTSKNGVTGEVIIYAD